MSRRFFGIWVRLLLTTTVLFLGYGVLQAQSIQYGKISGKVLDRSNEPVPGAQVEITSDALISGKRVTTTSENGTYIFLSLPIGTYRVSASLTGFKTAVRDNLPISSGVAATVDFVMDFGAIEESVDVSATESVVDKKNSTVETKLDEQMITKLPTSRDAFYDLALTAPGMFDAGKDSAWLPSPTAYGSATNENVFMVNGVNATDPRGGSWGSLVNVNYDSVEEVRIVALGAKAEYGSATGAAIDVITKSGGNQFSGQVSVYGQLGDPANNQPSAGDDLGADWLTLDPSVDLLSKTEKDREFSVTFGGPIVKDKVWFYTGFDAITEDLKKPLWPVVLDNKSRYFDAKISAEPMANNSFWASYHLERNKTLGDTWGDNVPWDSTLQFGNNTSDNSISTQWEWFPNSKSLFTAKYLGFWTNDDPALPSNAPANPGYINWWKWQAFGVNGHFPYIEAHDSSRHTVQADMSRYVEDFLGQQDIKFGVQYTTGTGNEMGGYFLGYANFAYPLRWSQDIPYTQETYGDTGMLWYVDQISLPPFETVRKFRQIGTFIDDQWTPTSRLTLNLGLRFDNMSNRYGEGKVFAQPDDPTTNVEDLSVVRSRAGTGNVFDFNNLSPRIGATYSITEDGKTVMRANFGRYYMPVGLENLRRFGPDMPLSNTHRLFMNVPWDQVDLNHNGFIDPDEVTDVARLLKGTTPYSDEFLQSDPSWQAKVADGTKNQYSDQMTFNFEREIAPNLSFGATFMYKRTGNILVNYPINRATGESFEYERKPFTTTYGQQVNLYSIVLKDYNSDGVIDDNDIQWISDNTDFEVRNLDSLDGQDPDRVYKGLQFVLNKRFSNRWQMLGSFLYSMSHGPANRNNFQDWNIEGPMIMDTGFFSSLNNSINNMTGPLPFTPKYEVKVSGSYQVPKLESNLGFRVRYSSGRPYWFLEEIPVVTSFSDAPNGVIAPGSGSSIIVGVDPNNPAYLPSALTFDLRLERSFVIRGRQSVGVSLDCFNIFNNNSVTNADYQYVIGQATAVTSPSRKFRLGLSYEF